MEIVITMNFGKLLYNDIRQTVYGSTALKIFLGCWGDAFRHPPP